MLLVIYYGILCSVILEHAVGLERLFIFSHSSFDWFYYLKNFFLSLIAALISFLFLRILPSIFLYCIPLLCIVVLRALETTVSLLFKKKSIAENEKNFLYGITMFALFQAYDVASLIVIIITGFLSLMVCDIILKSMNRLIADRKSNYYMKLGVLSLMCVGIIIIAVKNIDAFWVSQILVK